MANSKNKANANVAGKYSVDALYIFCEVCTSAASDNLNEG